MKCKHCGKPLTKDEKGTLVDNTGGDVCGTYGTFGNEPHVAEPVKKYMASGGGQKGKMVPTRFIGTVTTEDGVFDAYESTINDLSAWVRLESRTPNKRAEFSYDPGGHWRRTFRIN